MKVARSAAIALVGCVAGSCGVREETARDASRTHTARDTRRIEELRSRFAGTLTATSALDVAPRAARVALPRHAGESVELEDLASGVAVRFAVDGATAAVATVDGDLALYSGALDGADLLQRVHAGGTEDFALFETRPPRAELRYIVDVARVAGLRLVASTLELLDGGGAPRLRVAPPYVVDARGERHAATLDVEGCVYDASPAPPWARAVTAPGASRCTVVVAWAEDVAYPVLVDPAWMTTGAMSTPRVDATATTLASGRVLVVGGRSSSAILASAEIYDPATGLFAATGSLTAARKDHTASVLPSGKVLVAGGFASGSLSSAEIYDPATGQFTPAGAMGTARHDHTATVLASGKVLVVGGKTGAAWAPGAELFDSATAQFTPTGSPAAARAEHVAAALGSGKVLVAGGSTAEQTSGTASAELYDPASGTFSATGPLGTGRYGSVGVVLGSGKVLVAGGFASLGGVLASAELYDPMTGTFKGTTPMATRRHRPAGAELSSGKVLVAGGSLPGGATTPSAELYDPAAGSFAPGPEMAVGREYHAIAALAFGKALVVGGASDPSTFLASAELYGGTSADACTTGAQCLSGFCANGICCDKACTTGCDRCDLPGKEGTCSAVPAGTVGAEPICAPYVCDGASTACPTSCSSDDACAVDAYCDASGSCKPAKARGAACNAKATCKAPGACRECGAGFCVDGVCCNAPCTGTCESCLAAQKQSGLDDGTCGPTKDGIDPRDGCVASDVLCGGDGQCNGTGACRLVTPAGVACAEQKVCDGNGACVSPPSASCDGDHTTIGADGTRKDCTPYTCTDDGACRTACSSVRECVAPTVCDATGRCVPPPESGADEGGCAVVPLGTTRDGGPSVMFVLALALLARSRSRCARKAAR